MAQHNPSEIYYTKSYYSYNDELYARTFPEEWAKTHAPNTGPHNCKMCKQFGFWNGVFIGYCVKCAVDVYKYERCLGLVNIGKEADYCSNLTTTEEEYYDKSMFNTYMKNIHYDDVGDKDFYDSASVVNLEYDYSDIEDLIMFDFYD